MDRNILDEHLKNDSVYERVFGFKGLPIRDGLLKIGFFTLKLDQTNIRRMRTHVIGSMKMLFKNKSIEPYNSDPKIFNEIHSLKIRPIVPYCSNRFGLVYRSAARAINEIVSKHFDRVMVNSVNEITSVIKHFNNRRNSLMVFF